MTALLLMATLYVLGLLVMILPLTPSTQATLHIILLFIIFGVGVYALNSIGFFHNWSLK